MEPDFWGLPPVGWQAISTITSVFAFVIAAGGAAAAWKQYRVNLQTRDAQARPYVIADFEASPVSVDLMVLAVRNVGATPAYELTVRLTPEPERAMRQACFDFTRTRLLSGTVSMFAPGREVSLFFDSMSERDGTDLPSTYEVTVSYRDPRGRRYTEHSTIDLDISRGVLRPDLLGLHEAAEALQGMRDDLHRSPLRLGPFPVVAENRADYLDRIRDEER